MAKKGKKMVVIDSVGQPFSGPDGNTNLLIQMKGQAEKETAAPFGANLYRDGG